MNALIYALVSAFVAGIASPAVAQSVNAADKTAPVYRSVFSGYRGMTDEKVEWKEANDAVGRIGGWRTYLRESQDAGPAAVPAEKPQGSKPPASGNSGTAAHKHEMPR